QQAFSYADRKVRVVSGFHFILNRPCLRIIGLKLKIPDEIAKRYLQENHACNESRLPDAL
ncbi:MAG: hypothetical protein P8184_19945, partial [Calditrichia bacterium]